MAKFLFQASYTPEGARGLRKEGGTARRAAVQHAVESLGGSLESFHFGFGRRDAYVIADLPDVEAAAAVSLTVGGGGAVELETVALLTPEQVDEAAKRSVDYTPPGG
jgi:uncharacterized protein with GYD domain